MATCRQVSPQMATPGGIPGVTHVSQSPSPSTMLKTPEVASISPIPQTQVPLMVVPANLTEEVLWLQGQMNAAREQLLTTRATMDSHHREMELNAKLIIHMNVAQAIKAIRRLSRGDQGGWGGPHNWDAKVCHATTIKDSKLHCTTRIKEAEVHHTTTSCVLQQFIRESMLALEGEGTAEEGQDCQPFVEASRVALWACLSTTHVALMFCLQLLTGNVPLAAILGIPASTQPWAVDGRELTLTASISSVSEMLVPLTGTKWWPPFISSVSIYAKTRTGHHSWGATLPKWKEGRPTARPLKENCCETFSKECKLVRTAGQDYFKTHQPNYEHKGSQNLSSTFREMATSTNLMVTEVHEVQDAWTS